MIKYRNIDYDEPMVDTLNKFIAERKYLFTDKMLETIAEYSQGPGGIFGEPPKGQDGTLITKKKGKVFATTKTV